MAVLFAAEWCLPACVLLKLVLRLNWLWWLFCVQYLIANPDPKARFNLFKGYMERYNKSLARDATEEYVKVAQKYGLTPTQLALAWCRWVLACCAVV